MKVAYIDTSFLAAIAFDEPGRSKLVKRLKTFDRLVSSNLLEAELLAALAREGIEESPSSLLSNLDWLYPDRPLTEEFRRVLSAGTLRGADLWHLACALYLSPDAGMVSFLTLDVKQATMAEELGFQQ